MSASGKTIIVFTSILLVFGLVMLLSAGVVDGQKKFGSSYYYFNHQILFGVLPGILLFFILSRIDYRFWKKMALPLLLAAVALLVLVFVPGIGFSLKGAHRWIDLRLFTFQPSEALKLALVVYLAAWFTGYGDKKHKVSYATLPFFVIMGFIWVIFVKQPDVGTLGIITAIAFALYFFSGAGMKQVLSLVAVVIAVLGLLIIIAPYRLDRWTSFLNRDEDTQGRSYHINQALIAIGSGGIFGEGFGQSQQKKGFLPEPIGDSIFAVVGEEFGLVGMTTVMALFCGLILTMIKIAKNASDNFGRLLVLGFSVWIVSQAFINIAAISGLIPLTGVPLPFISYGGTSLMALLGALGISMNVAKQS